MRSWPPDRRLWRSTPCSIATAHATASTADWKTTMRPSPRFLTSWPPWEAIASRNSWKCTRRTAPRGVFTEPLEQFGGADQVREQQRDCGVGRHQVRDPGSAQSVRFPTWHHACLATWPRPSCPEGRRARTISSGPCACRSTRTSAATWFYWPATRAGLALAALDGAQRHSSTTSSLRWSTSPTLAKVSTIIGLEVCSARPRGAGAPRRRAARRAAARSVGVLHDDFR